MPESLPLVYLARHGETAWSVSGQHTGRIDLPLTAQGERNARRLGERLAALQPACVLTSPLERASWRALVPWQASIRISCGGITAPMKARRRRRFAARPGWEIFRDGCPGGESLAQVAARADRVVAHLRAIGANVLVFSSGHLLRVLAARWLPLDGALGRYFFLETAALSILGYQRDLTEPVIRLWNDCRHLGH